MRRPGGNIDTDRTDAHAHIVHSGEWARGRKMIAVPFVYERLDLAGSAKRGNGPAADRARVKGEPVKVLKVDHVGVAVSDKESAERFLTGVLGARKVIDESWVYNEQEFNWAYFLLGEQGMIELISSSDPDNFVNRFIDKRGEGLHHVTLQVEDLLEAVEFLQSKGVRVVDINTDNPFWKEAYISPRDAFGVLIQLAEFDESYWAQQAVGERPPE
jgi:methylmalonyl-CoA/ethylmalonyl-CoA epimerase